MISVNLLKHKEMWKLAYRYEAYCKGEAPYRTISSESFQKFLREDLGFTSAIVRTGDIFGKFELDEKDYVVFSLRYL